MSQCYVCYYSDDEQGRDWPELTSESFQNNQAAASFHDNVSHQQQVGRIVSFDGLKNKRGNFMLWT